MIRTEWQGDADRFQMVEAPLPVRTPEGELANAVRCLAEDVASARSEYVLRRRQIGLANKDRLFGKWARATAFRLFNRARIALAGAEAAQAALLGAH